MVTVGLAVTVGPDGGVRPADQEYEFAPETVNVAVPCPKQMEVEFTVNVG